MTNTISVPRILAEAAVALMELNEIDGIIPDGLREILSAPAVEVEGLVAEGYFFQHEETGQVMHVDAQQVEWGFEKNNPRLIKMDALCSLPKAQAIIDALRTSLAATVKESLTAGKAQMARDSAELRRLCAERDKLKTELALERDALRKQLDEVRGLLKEARLMTFDVTDGKAGVLRG